MTMRIREIFLRDWDPIGVSSVPQAQDEYERYVSEFSALIRSGTDQRAIVDRLLEIESQDMGLEPDRERAVHVAGKLTALT